MIFIYNEVILFFFSSSRITHLEWYYLDTEIGMIKISLGTMELGIRTFSKNFVGYDKTFSCVNYNSLEKL